MMAGPRPGPRVAGVHQGCTSQEPSLQFSIPGATGGDATKPFPCSSWRATAGWRRCARYRGACSLIRKNTISDLSACRRGVFPSWLMLCSVGSGALL